MTRESNQAVQPALWAEFNDASEPIPAEATDHDWEFSQSTRRDLTHGLHPWPAKFIPDIPAKAIARYSRPGDTVLDPFCGSGTTALEALRQGRGFVMADVNPFAIRVSEGKCEVPDDRERLAITMWAAGLTVARPHPDLLEQAPPIPNFDYWFSPEVTAQLVSLRGAISSLGVARAFLETAFSSIIVAVSNQESETRYRRVAKSITAEETLARFLRRLDGALRMAAEVSAMTDRELPRVYRVADARDLSSSVDESVALAVFSPPYPNTFDYHLYHRFRMFWLGFDPRTVKPREIGAHLRYEPGHLQWLSDMGDSFRGLRGLLRPAAHVVCVVGDGVAQGQILPSGELLWASAPSWGFRHVLRARRSVPSHRKSFNLSDSRLRHEEVLVFQV
jgi:site-specific DNA-methyltransferase (cytosine-N4-specific)